MVKSGGELLAPQHQCDVRIAISIDHTSEGTATAWIARRHDAKTFDRGERLETTTRAIEAARLERARALRSIGSPARTIAFDPARPGRDLAVAGSSMCQRAPRRKLRELP
jgi:hypothetical protein